MARDDPQQPRTGRPGGGRLVMTLICAAQFVLQLDFSIVNVALPTIQRELGMAAAQLQAADGGQRPVRAAEAQLRKC